MELIRDTTAARPCAEALLDNAIDHRRADDRELAHRALDILAAYRVGQPVGAALLTELDRTLSRGHGILLRRRAEQPHRTREYR